MKIISGLYKGRKLEGIDIVGTRPTMDRVKESLFGMIQSYLADALILDLFAGSGNLGIEALSNGGKYCYLVDINKKASLVQNNNIKSLGVSNIEVINKDFSVSLKYFYDNNIKFDVIFLDPPYKSDYIDKSLDIIFEYSLLNDNGIIICESDCLNRINYLNKFVEIKQRKYGDKYIVLLKNL